MSASTGQPAELESILAVGPPFNGSCAVGPPCVDAAFNTSCVAGCTATGATPCSCTQSGNYWSATTLAGDPGSAWGVDFLNGYVSFGGKPYGLYVRAVRDGL